MKILGIIAVAAFLTPSCKSTWSKEDKEAFYEACTERAVTWAGTKENATLYCDCVYAKMVARYPSVSDAMEHMDLLAKDTGLINCREEVKKQFK